MSVRASVYVDTDGEVSTGAGTGRWPYLLLIDGGRAVIHMTEEAAHAISAALDAQLYLAEADARSDAFHEHVLDETREEDL